MDVDYTTRYSARRKRLALTVMQDATVYVDAPAGTPAETVEAFVRRKSAWLYTHLLEGDTSAPKPFRHPWKSGRPVVYRGRSYPLLVTDDLISEPLTFKGGRFMLSRADIVQADELLEAWYKDRARERIGELIAQYSGQLGVEPREVRVVGMKNCWGSCTAKGTVSINWKLIKAPAFVLRYVVIHELAHLLQLNHSKDFWRIVAVQMPEFRRGKGWLREFGGEIL